MNIDSYKNAIDSILPNSVKASPFIEESLTLLLLLTNENEKVISILKENNKLNLIENLIIILDHSTEDLENDFFYICLSFLLKLSSYDVLSSLFNTPLTTSYHLTSMNMLSGDVIDCVY